MASMMRARRSGKGLLLMLVALGLLTTGLAPGRSDAQSTPSAPVVRLPFPQEDGSLTPYTFELGYSLMTLVYDTLFWRDEQGVPQPWLARSAETSADGKQVTIRLTEGARWHDGRPVTATDVAFTFDYVAKHPNPRFTSEVRAVQRVTAPDPSTVVISLRSPSPGLLDQPLADLPILPAHIWRSLPADRIAPEGLPVGSGPYRLVEHQPGRLYRFEADSGYFRGPPAVKSIEVPIITGADETLQALERRQVDVIPVSLPEDAAARVKSIGVASLGGPSYLGTALVFNVRRPPFDRVEVRRAIARALDLVRIARLVGDAVPADRGYLHPDSPWASPQDLHVFDEAGARRELAGLGVSPLDILAPDNDPVKLDAAREVALALERAGLRATSRAVPREELSRAVGEDGSPPSFQAAIRVVPPLASYDPDFLRKIFGSDPGEAPLNEAGYVSPSFDALSDRIATTSDPAARSAVVREALRLLATDAPVVPLLFSNGTYTFRPAIYDGWVFVKGSGIVDKRSFVEPKLRAASTGPPVGSATEGGRGPLGLIAAALGVVAVVMLVVGLLRHRF